MLKRLIRKIIRPGAPAAPDPAAPDALLLYIGTTTAHHHGWWNGELYPSRLIGTDMRGYYAHGFDTIEIRSTFYQPPKAGMLANWAEQVPDEFRFALLASSRITHLQRLEQAEEPTRRFLRATQVLGPRRGPLLFQLPRGFPKDAARLARFIERLPAGIAAAFEFLDPSWQDDAIYDKLREGNCAVCVSESDAGETSPFVTTGDWGYLRLGRASYSDEELAGWLERIQKTSWRNAYVYVRRDDAERAQDHAQRLKALAGGAEVQESS